MLTLVLFGLLGAQAQVAYDQSVSLRVARFTEMVRIQMASLVTEPEDEVAEAMRENSRLFLGSLQRADSSLAAKLEAALTQAQDLAEKGRGSARLNRRVRWLLDQTQRTLIPRQTRQDPAFQAALLAQLLNLEEGVAEAYEEAAQGEEEAYPLAWAGLQRVNLLWRQLRPRLSNGEGRQKSDDALARLGKLIASPEPPERYSDPEDAEQAALDAAYGLEQAAGKPLLLQDLSRAFTLTRVNAAQACRAAEGGQWGLALEWASAANVYYEQHLAATVQTLAPQAHTPLAEAMEELAEEVAERETPDELCGKLPGLLARAGEPLR